MRNRIFSNYRILKTILLSLGLCVFFLPSYSQNEKIELSHYLFPDFIRGSVFLSSGVKQATILNYNTLTEEMVFQDRGRILAIGEESLAKIDSITIEGRKFVPIDNKFFEILHESGHNVLAEHKCRVNMPGRQVGYGGTSHTSSVTSVSSLQADGLFYQLKLPDNYETQPYTNYWIEKGGELTQFIKHETIKTDIQ
jgi:hypothetical protein